MSAWLKATPGASCTARAPVLPLTSGWRASMRPRRSTMPARSSTATASSTPEPHSPTAGLWPIVCTASRPPCRLTRSIAPSAARMPQPMWPPSSAGPEGQEADRMRPSWISEISVLVPMSITSAVRTACHCGAVASSAATWSPPTKPPTLPARCTTAPPARCRPSSRALCSCGAQCAATNGARPSWRTGRPSSRWCIAVLPQITTSTMCCGRAPTASARSCASASIAVAAAARSSSSAAALPIAWLMRLTRSAPQPACGFSMPRLARRFPLRRSIRKPAALVVPRSTARPSSGASAGATSISSSPRRRTLHAPALIAQHLRQGCARRRGRRALARPGPPRRARGRCARHRRSGRQASVRRA